MGFLKCLPKGSALKKKQTRKKKRLSAMTSEMPPQVTSEESLDDLP